MYDSKVSAEWGRFRQTTLTLYGGAGQWLGDYDATGQPLQQAIWFVDLPVQRSRIRSGASLAGRSAHRRRADARAHGLQWIVLV